MLNMEYILLNYKHIKPLTKFFIHLRIRLKIKKSPVNQPDNCDRSHSVYDIRLLHLSTVGDSACLS